MLDYLGYFFLAGMAFRITVNTCVTKIKVDELLSGETTTPATEDVLSIKQI